VISAGIFDMDGVLLDSEPLHHAAVNEILAAEGHAAVSFADYSRYLGTTDEYTWDDLIHRYGLQKPLSSYRDRFNAVILGHYRGHSTIAPGVQALLDTLKAHGLPLAVASSSRQAWVETCLAALGIRRYFDVLVAGDMVARGKPDPAIYLLAARRLGTPPQECFAVEDSPKGIAAALAAGMLTVAVDTPYTRSQLPGAAHIHLRALTEFDCSFLEAGATLSA
jgi:HAD superfamily hydrolase (TIGR01509 family)